MGEQGWYARFMVGPFNTPVVLDALISLQDADYMFDRSIDRVP
jgi:hypothetical protein